MYLLLLSLIFTTLVFPVSVVTAYLESPQMLVILDISNPDNPRMVRYHKLSSPAEDILVVGRMVFVLHGESLENLIIGDDGEVKLYTSKSFKFEVSSFDARRDRIVVSYGSTVYVMDSTLNTVGTVSTKWNILSLRFFDYDHVVLNFGKEGIGLLNLENPADPRIVWRLEARFESIADVIPHGENLFVLCESGMLFVVNMVEPLKPKVVKYTYLPENARKGMIYDDTLVVISPSKKLMAVDISDPFEPKLLFTKYLGSDTKDVDLVFGNVYVAKRGGTYIYKLGKIGLSFVNYVPAMSVLAFARKRVSPPEEVPPGKILWSYSVGSEIRSSPAVGDGNVYFASVNGMVFALDMDGKFLWSYRARFLITSPVVYSNGRIYVGSWDNYLYTLNDGGDLVWRVRLGGDVSRAVVVDEKRVYAGAEDGKFYAVEDGKVIWSKELDGWMTTNPVLFSDGRVVLGTSGGKVYCFSYAGNVLWIFDAEGWISSGMAVDESENLYFGTTDGKLFVISKEGNLVWKYDVGSEISSGPVVDSFGRVVFGTREGTLYVLDRKGNLMWTYHVGSVITSGIAVSKEGFVYFGAEDGYLYSLNPDGSLRWKVSTGGKIVTTPLILKSKILFGSTDGKFYAVYDTTEGLNDGPWPMCCGNEEHNKIMR